jgi:hypothetical protein
MCDINLFRSYYIISARSMCLVFLAWNVKILRPIWYIVIVRNVFSYSRMNAYKNIFVYISLHTFLKWPVFPSLTKTLQIKLTSEIGFHIK